MTEKQLQTAIVELATVLRYLVFHAYDSRRSDGQGFPDLVLLRPDRLIVAELKVGRNQPTIEQTLWLESFRRAGVETYLWRDTDWTSGGIATALR